MDYYRTFSLLDHDEWRLLERFRIGVDKGETFPQIKVNPNPREKKTGDFPYLTPGLPVFSERAMEAYKDLLAGKVKFLPIVPAKAGGIRYFIVQVINLIDCLDYEKSVIDYYPHDPSRMAGVDLFAFKPEMVADQIIFKIPEASTWTFVTEKFIACGKAAGLKGLSFSAVWDSETGGIKETLPPQISRTL